MSLYLKYRPQQFSQLVGQEHVKTTIQNAFKADQVAHAYLFCGPRGTGKTSAARLVAKSLNCPNFNPKTVEPCIECDICRAISDGSLIDIIEIDAASNRGIDEIRELKETIRFAPSQVKNKVYIIDEVHMLTNEAFNALLKTLEEPPENVYFILATTEVHKIPDTIISRCQRFDFRRLSEKTIDTRLALIAQNEGIDMESGTLSMISHHVDGGLRDAIGLLEQLTIDGKITIENTKSLIGSTGLDVIESFLQNLIDKDEANAIAIIQNLYDEGYDLHQFQYDFIKFVRGKLRKAIEDSDDEAQVRIVKILEELQKVNDSFKNSVIPQLPLEVFVVKVCVGQKPIRTVKKATPVDEVEVIEEMVEQVIEEYVEEDIPHEVEIDPIEAVEDNPEVAADVDIEKMWKQMIDRINKPTLRRSLQQARIHSVDTDKIELAFDSDFHYNAVNNAESLAAAEQVVNELSGAKYRIEVSRSDVKLVPKKLAKIDAEPVKEVESNKDDLLAEAMDLFGGEVVD